MPTESSIRFDTGAARLLAVNRGWSLHEWARQADTTYKTLTDFLKGNPRLKLITVEQILRPLGVCAADIQLPRKAKPCAEAVTK